MYVNRTRLFAFLLPLSCAAGPALAESQSTAPSGLPGMVAWLGAGRTNAQNAPVDFAGLKRSLWGYYKQQETADPQRAEEHSTRRLGLGTVMRYEYTTVGALPPNGYPLYIALHGGGSAPAEVNDAGWKDMQAYYLASVKSGIYVAPRGVANTWNLHSVPDAYPLYDRLIENMILFEGVDPNRVYLLGYSAGGDGVYQIAPRMADRFAAASMSAGHPNGISPLNLYNLPFLMQAGELDKAYGRNRITAQFALRLADLQAQYSGGFVHDGFVHLGRGHGIIDRDPQERPQLVIANMDAWLRGTNAVPRPQNANSIAWVSRYVRNPWPPRVIWDLSTRADRPGGPATGDSTRKGIQRGSLSYWLEVRHEQGDSAEKGLLDVSVDKPANTITINQPIRWFRILLNQQMLDLSKPVHVMLGGSDHVIRPKPDPLLLAQTLCDRGDPNYMFEAGITVEQTAAGGWNIQ